MTRYHGRHRKPTATGRTVAKVAVTGMVVGAPLTAFAAPASAAGGHDWSGVAQCESSGNWHANTGNGFKGGLQFTDSTWAAYGGSGSADNASTSEQVRVAENVLAGQGAGAWPVCGARLTSGSTPGQAQAQAAPAQRTAATQQQVSPAPKQQSTKAAAPQATTPKVAAPKQQSTKAAAPRATVARTAPASTTAAGNYTVQSGDTLAKIAAAQGVSGGYQAIFALNQDKIQNVNLIFPGQTLRLL